MNLLLTSNIKTFCCGWFKEDIVEKNPRSLRSHWSFSAHRLPGDRRYLSKEFKQALRRRGKAFWVKPSEEVVVKASRSNCIC
jgi:hypothetical protein